jgi:hypothetical protein
MENKAIYSEVDLSIRVSPLQSSDEENNIDSEDDDDFMSVEDIQKYIKTNLEHAEGLNTTSELFRSLFCN